MGIKRIQSLLQKNTFEQCSRYTKSLLAQRKATFFTNRAWDYSVIHDSPPVLIHPLSVDNPLYNQIEGDVFQHVSLVPKKHNILFYLWTKGSYIPWHADPTHEGGLTIYLNNSWDRNYGGLFLYEDGEEIKAIIPQPNLGILQQGKTQHATTPVIHKADIRFTLQIWF